jgi:hypothetical protein
MEVADSREDRIYELAFFADRENARVRSGLVSLRNALSGDPDCLTFLESGIAGGSTAVFNAFYNRLVGGMAGAVDFRGTELPDLNGVTDVLSTGYFITINSSGGFFSNLKGAGYADKFDAQVRSIRGGTPEAQYFILLHELAHFFKATGFIPGDSGAYPGDLRGQRINNDLLWKNCNKTIQGAGKGIA